MIHDRRFDPRVSCSDHVSLEWHDAAVRKGAAEGQLTDISLSGARLQTDGPVPVIVPVRVVIGERELKGTIRYCFRGEGRYVVGIEFDMECQRVAAAIMRANRRATALPTM